MNKNIFALAFVMIIFCTHSFGQSFKLGLKVGTDIKKLSGKSFDDQFSYGYHVGAFAQLGLNSRLGIQPEVYFSQVNIDTTSNFRAIHEFKQVSKIQLKYLTIPILVNYNPNKYLSLQAGPQFGILMEKGNTLVQNGKEAFKKGDFSMVAGAQLNISKIRLYGRYGVGLSNLNDIDNRDKWKTQTIQLGLGFIF